MGENQGHAAMLGNPVKLSQPDGRRLFLQKHEEGGVLGQGVRKLNITATRRAHSRELRVARRTVRLSIRRRKTRYPKRKNGVMPFRLRLEWVSVEGGSIVLDIQL